jgi:NADH:ubiquinone oxidoreductase subunit 2 (subunit N)
MLYLGVLVMLTGLGGELRVEAFPSHHWASDVFRIVRCRLLTSLPAIEEEDDETDDKSTA